MPVKAVTGLMNIYWGLKDSKLNKPQKRQLTSAIQPPPIEIKE
jgi:hypothetical protein